MRLSVQTPSGPAEVELEVPKAPKAPSALVVIGHGAGGGIEAPDIKAAASACVGAGFAVARVVQPYRVAGRRSPAAAPQLDAAWLSVIAALQRKRALRDLPLIAAGRSSGARVACRTATATRSAGVFCLAFPLHPPGRPDKTRLPELDMVDVPVLIVQGDRDPFGIPPQTPTRTVLIVPGADHSLRKDTAGTGQAVAAFVGLVTA